MIGEPENFKDEWFWRADYKSEHFLAQDCKSLRS
jgi:hypothetical protein